MTLTCSDSCADPEGGGAGGPRLAIVQTVELIVVVVFFLNQHLILRRKDL